MTNIGLQNIDSIRRDLPWQVSTNDVFAALKQKNFFKLVCGASLTDVQMIENLSFIFSLAGAHVIDVASMPDVILAARKGIKRAVETSHGMSLRLHNIPLIMASIQLDEDPHFRKAEVDFNLCDVCGACVKVCPTEAFKIDKQFLYSKERCFGCGICPDVCHVDAIKMIDTRPLPKETLQDMLLLGVRSIEFHFGKNYKKVLEIWHEIKDLVKELTLVSFSIGSDLLSTEDIKTAANLCFNLAGPDIILQCDGIPMSGGLENKSLRGNNTDSQSLQVAKIIEEEKLPVFLQISGGTNQHSFKRSVESGLNINGVAIGSYARKQLMPFMDKLDSESGIRSAVEVASILVKFNCK